jgi:hypothetical protein
VLGVTDITHKTKPYVRVTYEALLSLNAAWLMIWYFGQRGSLEQLSHYLINLYWHSQITEPQIVLEQVAWSLVLATLIFLAFRIGAQVSQSTVLLHTLGGAFALIGFPLFGLRFPDLFFQSLANQGRFTVQTLWLVLEVLFILNCGLLYYMQRWSIPTALSILFLALHFGLWGWATGNYVGLRIEIQHYGFGSFAFFVSTMFYFGFPVLGFLSSLGWAFYVRESA